MYAITTAVWIYLASWIEIVDAMFRAEVTDE